MRLLDVWLYDRLVGTISETRRGGRFAYTQDVCEEMPGVLSLSLPVKRRPYNEGETASWFEGLLPEGARREDVSNGLRISAYDWIGLLAEIGWECAGAVRIFEHGDTRTHQGSYESISAGDLAARLSSIPYSISDQVCPPYRRSMMWCPSPRSSLGPACFRCASAERLTPPPLRGKPSLPKLVRGDSPAHGAIACSMTALMHSSRAWQTPRNGIPRRPSGICPPHV